MLSGAALASIPLSGQVHLALGAIPFFLAYAIVRTRDVRLLAGSCGACLAAVGAGILVRETLIKGSTQAGGRSLEEVTRYSARFGDFLSRHVDSGRSEQFVFLGWLTPLAALAGLVLLLHARRYALAALLGLGAVIPIALGLGTHTAVYSPLWHALPPFRFPRVPERLLPIACLCIAALVAFVVARIRVWWIVPVAVALVLVDLHASIYDASAAGNPERVVPESRGRLLELPVFDPDVHFGSVYLWYDTAAQRERPGGYSTTAPIAGKRAAERLHRLNCGDWTDDTVGELRRLGVGAVALHRGLYARNPAVPDTVWFAWRSLLARGWTVQRTDGAVSLFEPRPIGLQLRVAEPPRDRPVFCQGWYGDTSDGRYMSERHAPFWIYGSGRLRLRFADVPALSRRVLVDGRPSLALRRPGWHLVTVDVPHLVHVAGVRKPVGAKLVAVATSPSRGIRNPRTGSSP